MMTFSHRDIATFLRARSRASQPALDALRDLESRGICSAPTVRISTPTALAHRCCAHAGRKINELTSGDLAEIIWPSAPTPRGP